jgi:hypothetical protein
VYATSNTVGVVTVPSAPTNVVAGRTGDGTSCIITFDLPFNGGATITSYAVTSSPAGINYFTYASLLSQPIALIGLSTSTAYTFSITATNGIGTSSAGVSNSMGLTVVPNAPTSVSAVRITGASATLTWTPPTPVSPITSYTITSVPALISQSVSVSGLSLPVTINGLTPSNSYYFTVKAVNAGGPGSPGTSNTVNPITVPNPPTGISVIRNTSGLTAGTTAFVSWTDGLNLGPTATGYTITTSPTTVTTNVSYPASLPATISNLDPLTAYTIYVTTDNAGGSSAAGTGTLAADTQVYLEYLVVGGGGGGSSFIGGGGGAGGVLSSSVSGPYALAYGGSLSVSIGTGGGSNTSGNNSTLGSFTAIGGGRGGQADSGPSGQPGGSGGGGAGPNFTGGGSGTAGPPRQGYNGGSGGGGAGGGRASGGGGGGAGSIGESIPSQSQPGKGGIGITSTITGVTTAYAGGGGGGGDGQGNTAAGGSYPTADSYSPYGAGTGNGNTTGGAATDGTGSGGGGGYSGPSGSGSTSNGGKGGNGVVIIAYLTAYPALRSISGVSYTYDNGVTRPGYRVYKFTSGSGSITW